MLWRNGKCLLDVLLWNGASRLLVRKGSFCAKRYTVEMRTRAVHDDPNVGSYYLGNYGIAPTNNT